MKENVRQKASRYLIEGRLIVIEAKQDFVRAKVGGEGAIYDTGFVAGVWFCNCPARGDACCHLLALRRVAAPDLAPPPFGGAVSVRRPDKSFEGRR